MNYDDCFNAVVKYDGLRIPYEVDINNFLKMSDGIELDGNDNVIKITKIEDLPDEVTDKERQNYFFYKYLFIAENIYDDDGYEKACEYLRQMNIDSLNYFKKNYKPCEGHNGQCCFDCPRYGECDGFNK